MCCHPAPHGSRQMFLHPVLATSAPRRDTKARPPSLQAQCEEDISPRGNICVKGPSVIVRGNLREEVFSSICLKPGPRRSHSQAHVYFNRGQRRGRQRGEEGLDQDGEGRKECLGELEKEACCHRDHWTSTWWLWFFWYSRVTH